MKFPQVLQRTLIGSIIRTFICFSSERTRFPRGTLDGSKSGGKYLLRTAEIKVEEIKLVSKSLGGGGFTAEKIDYFKYGL
jgi:hypothetical protein